jgi:hypothetical protein
MIDNPLPSDDPASAPLNLKKFAPGPAVAGEPAAAAGDGQTLFIKKSAAESVAHLGDPAQAHDETFGLPLQDILGVITYCYVRGVFSSKEIAEKLKYEPQLRKSFGRHLPDEGAIKAFRRRYAAEIEELLETVYRAFPPASSNAPAGAGRQPDGDRASRGRRAVARRGLGGQHAPAPALTRVRRGGRRATGGQGGASDLRRQAARRSAPTTRIS